MNFQLKLHFFTEVLRRVKVQIGLEEAGSQAQVQRDNGGEAGALSQTVQALNGCSLVGINFPGTLTYFSTFCR